MSGSGKATAPASRDHSPGDQTAGEIEAVVVAAGSSARMGGVDKLDAELDGRPILRWSLEALASAGVERMVVVTTPARMPRLATMPWLPDQVIAVVAGGARRQESVAAGVAALVDARARRPTVGRTAGKGGGGSAREALEAPARNREAARDPVILVHDAARPLVSPALVRAVAAAATIHGAAVPVLAVTETLKRLSGDRIAATIDRKDVVAAQTPQGVRLSVLEKAYAAYPPDGPETWTDEASLLEACRIAVHAITGEATNIKVTVRHDLERAQALLDHGLVPGRAVSRPAGAGPAAISPGPAPLGRVGLGTDSHPFGPGGPLVLGGLRFEGAPRLVGHSDGDVVLHAVADALLGAAGLGDLGGLFPADSRTPAGIDSGVLLRAVADKVRGGGWRPVNVDVTVVAARPKLAKSLPSIATAIGEILGIEPAAVNVKASSGNLTGPEGAGRSISATAIVSLAPLDADAPEGTA